MYDTVPTFFLSKYLTLTVGSPECPPLNMYIIRYGIKLMSLWTHNFTLRTLSQKNFFDLGNELKIQQFVQGHDPDPFQLVLDPWAGCSD